MLHFFPPTVFFDVKAVGYLFSLVCQGSDGVASLYSLRNHGVWKIKDAANNRFIQPLGNAIWARILHRVKTEENLFRDVKSNEAVASSLQLLCWGTQRCFQASHQIICALCGLWVSPVTWETKNNTHTHDPSSETGMPECFLEPGMEEGQAPAGGTSAIQTSPKLTGVTFILTSSRLEKRTYYSPPPDGCLCN